MHNSVDMDPVGGYAAPLLVEAESMLDHDRPTGVQLGEVCHEEKSRKRC